MRSELITDQHLARCAVIYVRQSSPHQVLTNQESLRLQYDLRQRALGQCERAPVTKIGGGRIGGHGSKIGRPGPSAIADQFMASIAPFSACTD